MSLFPIADQTGGIPSEDVIHLSTGVSNNQTIIEGNANAQGDFVGRDKIDGYNINANTVNLYQGNQSNFIAARRVGVKLVLDRDFKSYTSDEQNRLLEAIRHLLTSDINITGIEPGSVIVHVELPEDQVDNLLALVKAGWLDEFGIKAVEFDTKSDYKFPISSELLSAVENEKLFVPLSIRHQNILHFLKTFIQEKEYPPTIREISNAVNIPRNTVIRILNKLEGLKFIKRDRDIARSIVLNWKLFLEYNIIDTLQESLQGFSTNHNNTFTQRIPLRIPILGHIAAGEPIRVEAIDPARSEQFVEIGAGFLFEPEKIFALRVRGDSLIDASILDGDIIILRHQENAKDGDLVAAWVEGDEETTLKYLFYEGKKIRLQPANRSYLPIILPLKKVRINGIAVAIIRTFQHPVSTQSEAE
ncbi:MAG: transcriptional repressor LexA [Caldilineaceae bacterium]